MSSTMKSLLFFLLEVKTDRIAIFFSFVLSSVASNRRRIPDHECCGPSGTLRVLSRQRQRQAGRKEEEEEEEEEEETH